MNPTLNDDKLIVFNAIIENRIPKILFKNQCLVI